MPLLIAKYRFETKIFNACSNKKFFRIGRHDDNDFQINDLRVSRFHATIFKYENETYLIDHSVNGTFYNPTAPTFEEDKKLCDASKTRAFQSYKYGQSHFEAFLEQEKEQVPRIIGYVRGKFVDSEDAKYLLDMINDPDQTGLLASQGKKLRSDGHIGIKLTGGLLDIVFSETK